MLHLHVPFLADVAHDVSTDRAPLLLYCTVFVLRLFKDSLQKLVNAVSILLLLLTLLLILLVAAAAAGIIVVVIVVVVVVVVAGIKELQ